MRTHRLTAVVVILSLSLVTAGLTLSGCGSDNSARQSGAAQADNATQPVDTLDQTRALYRTAADTLVARFARELKGELVAALAEGEAVGAIGVCRVVAPEIAAKHSVGGWTIQRVSDRNRNPDNRADTSEARFLKEFADTSELAPNFLVDWQPVDSGSPAEMQFAYYKPIRIQPMCLKCHGDMQTLGPGVYEALKKNYPLDKATGYRPGDLRGMFVVHADYPAATETALLLASGESLPTETDSVDQAPPE